MSKQRVLRGFKEVWNKSSALKWEKKKKLVVCKTKLFFKFDQNGSVFVSGYAWKTGIHPGPKQEQEGLRSDFFYYYNI